MYICVCKAVTDGDIHRAVQQGACCMRDLAETLGVGTECGQCREFASQCLEDACDEIIGSQATAA